MNKKFEFTGEKKFVSGVTLRRIRALRDFNGVKAGDIGGWLEYEANLSHVGNAWAYGNAQIYGNALVFDHAAVYGDAKVFNDAHVYGYAKVAGEAWVYGNVQVYGDAVIRGTARVDNDNALFWASKIGEDNGTVTVTKAQDGGLQVTRGSFTGPIKRFLERAQAVSNDKTYLEYQLLMQVARLRILGEMPK